jgi:hypothetical protein
MDRNIMTGSRLVRSLLDDKLKVRRAAPGSEETVMVQGLIEEVFVRERKYLETLGADPWDAVSYYYLLTQHGRPVGCIRIVDPGDFAEAPTNIPRNAGRVTFPMEEAFPLDAHISDTAKFIEPGRMVVLPIQRHKGAFILLMAIAYLYALQKGKRGGVWHASKQVVEPYLKTGWQPLGEPFDYYGVRTSALMANTAEATPGYASLFLEMEECGLVAI